MKYLSIILITCFTVSCFAQSYKVNYEKDGFKGNIQFEIVKGNYIFEDGFSYKIRNNVKNVIMSYKNGQYNDVLKRAGITFPITLNVSEANNTVEVTGNAYFYRSPQKSSQHSSQPSVRLSLYDPFPGIPDFSADAKEYVEKYAKEQNVNLWKTTGGLKNLEVTFVMLVDIKNKVEAAIRKADATKAQSAGTAQKAAPSSANITTDSKTWSNPEEESNPASRQNNNRNTAGRTGNKTTASPSGTTGSGSRTTGGNNTMSWEKQQALAKRQHEIRQQEQAQLEQSLAPLGETIVMMDNAIPDAKETWGDFYLGADDAGGLSAWRLGIESRMYHGDNFIIYFGFSGLLATKFDYYFVDDESTFRKAMYDKSRIGLELQLGFGSRILGEEENSEDAGSALFWGLLAYIGGINGEDLEMPDDIAPFNVMGYYGPRLLVGYRMSHVSFRMSYSLCFTDKRYYMGLGTPPGVADKHKSGLFQIQIGYSW